MVGANICIEWDDTQARFSPAGAGNTIVDVGNGQDDPVQPRGRGEHLVDVRRVGGGGGSAPRARGTRRQSAAPLGCSRFSTAGAGNTPGLSTPVRPQTVQPRGRGEHNRNPVGAPAYTGSAPRARGTRARDHRQPAVVRFSPASAGNTRRWSRPCPYRAVQPRGRGEHYSIGTGWNWVRGSAPRARGTRMAGLLPNEHTRFSPAGAGNTARPRGR